MKGVEMSLLKQARRGLREMPSNVAWVVNSVIGSTDDPIALRMIRAQDAANQAREAEERALEAAQEAKELSEHALHVSERGRARVDEIDREATVERGRRIQNAENHAEEFVRREREAAGAEAERRLREVCAEVSREIDDAEQNAEAAQQHAEALVKDARERKAEAKRLADEAAEAARLAAEEASRHAQRISDDAEQQEKEVAARVGLAEELRERTAETAQRVLRGGNNGNLSSYKKSELLELAAAEEIEGRSTMTKDELVAALKRTSRAGK
jgi:hypothetical protein